MLPQNNDVVPRELFVTTKYSSNIFAASLVLNFLLKEVIMVIGYRSFPNGFSVVVLEGTQTDPKYLISDRYTIPKSTNWPESLSWVRKQIAEIHTRHKVKAVCLKTIEPMAMKKSKERLQIEGVIQEYCFSELGKVPSVKIKSQLKRDIKDFKEPARYLQKVIAEKDHLEVLKHNNYQEAALAAISVLPA